MNQKTAREKQYSQAAGTLYLAFELGSQEWRLAFTIGLGQKPRERTMAAGAVGTLRVEIERAKERFHLAPSVRVVSCYEAGRDGFWLHRFLLGEGIEKLVVDSPSIEVKRRGRRVKTDRLDAQKLVAMLMRYDGGERKVWSVVRAPQLEDEENRQLHRELEELKGERTRLTNRIKGCWPVRGFGWRSSGTSRSGWARLGCGTVDRRQVGALAGLVPTPYQSGASLREAGISKAGSKWVRATAIEMAWPWVRFQPGSELARWYRERFGNGGSRMRRIGFVAVARRLLVDLWRYLDGGVVPAGAAIKA